jgi:hypothetical protein
MGFLLFHSKTKQPEKIKDKEIIYNFGRVYLKLKGQEVQPLKARESKFCILKPQNHNWKRPSGNNGIPIKWKIAIK